jgi:uncharacterized membrane protein
LISLAKNTGRKKAEKNRTEKHRKEQKRTEENRREQKRRGRLLKQLLQFFVSILSRTPLTAVVFYCVLLPCIFGYKGPNCSLSSVTQTCSSYKKKR